MKRLLIALLILFMATGAWAGGDLWCKGSDEQTDDAAITTSAGIFHGIIVTTDGQNTVTVSIYDHASAASGTEIIPTTTVAAAIRIQPISVSPGVRFYNGIYVDITTSGTTTYEVYYKNEND